MYKDIKIERYGLLENISDKVDTKSDFDLIDNYKGALQEFIFTDIKLIDSKEPIEKAFQSRLCIFISEFLLRSLMLKEGMVFALNTNNFPSYYATLKSFLEISAALGYVAEIIYKNDKYEEIISRINTLIMGNRKSGSFYVGNTEAVNVLTMFKKLDKVIKSIACEGKSKKECEEIEKIGAILSTIYADVCNFAHPNFNAHLSIGILRKDNIWSAKKNADGYKRELWSFYMPGFITGIEIIVMLCGLISRNSKVNNFNLITSKQYFE